MSESPSPITELELDLTVVEEADRFLRVTVVYRELVANADREELGDFVKSEIKRFRVRGALPVPMMTTFLRLETRINNALAAEDEVADRELEAVMEDAHGRIVSLIAERDSSAFKPVELEHDGRTIQAKPMIELGVSQILVMLSWIAGDTSVADAVAKALTAGRTPTEARSADEVAASAAAAPDAGADEVAGPDVPLPLRSL